MNRRNNIKLSTGKYMKLLEWNSIYFLKRSNNHLKSQLWIQLEVSKSRKIILRFLKVQIILIKKEEYFRLKIEMRSCSSQETYFQVKHRQLRREIFRLLLHQICWEVCKFHFLLLLKMIVNRVLIYKESRLRYTS